MSDYSSKLGLQKMGDCYNSFVRTVSVPNSGVEILELQVLVYWRVFLDLLLWSRDEIFIPCIPTH